MESTGGDNYWHLTRRSSRPACGGRLSLFVIRREAHHPVRIAVR